MAQLCRNKYMGRSLLESVQEPHRDGEYQYAQDGDPDRGNTRHRHKLGCPIKTYQRIRHRVALLRKLQFLRLPGRKPRRQHLLHMRELELDKLLTKECESPSPFI